MVRYQFCWYSHSYPRKKKPGKARRAKKRKDFLAFLESLGCHSRKSLESQEFTLGFHGKPRIWSLYQEQEKPRKARITENFPVFEGKAGVTNCSVAKNSQERKISCLSRRGLKHTQPHKKCSNVSIYLWDPPLIHVLPHSEMLINWTLNNDLSRFSVCLCQVSIWYLPKEFLIVYGLFCYSRVIWKDLLKQICFHFKEGK